MTLAQFGTAFLAILTGAMIAGVATVGLVFTGLGELLGWHSKSWHALIGVIWIAALTASGAWIVQQVIS